MLNMLPVNDIFTQEARDSILKFYSEYAPAQERFKFRTLPPKKVKTVFFGASISCSFPIHEFFPGTSFFNRSIPGETLDGLYARLEDDVFPYQPEQVVILVGLNGIEQDNAIMMRKYEALGDLLTARGIKTYYCSVTPLRHGDPWDRFKYQGKIIELNRQLQVMAEKKFAGFVDYFSVLLDPQGELDAEYAREDGTHINFEGYCVMAKVLEKSVPLY